MRPRLLVDADMEFWSEQGAPPRAAVFAGPEGVEPCLAVVTGDVVRVPWHLTPLEALQLADGGTLWLSTWGGLPPHMLEVQPK